MSTKRRMRPRLRARSRAKRRVYWSQPVTERSDALDLERGVYTKPTAHAIALSLKRSADRSRRRKAKPFPSAMSALNFYINRAGTNLSRSRRARLEAAKNELRVLYRRRRKAA